MAQPARPGVARGTARRRTRPRDLPPGAACRRSRGADGEAGRERGLGRRAGAGPRERLHRHAGRGREPRRGRDGVHARRPGVQPVSARVHAGSATGGFVLLCGALLAVETAVVASRAFAARPGPLAVAVTVDLVAVPLALGWLLLVRRARLTPWILVPVFLSSLLAARLLLPSTERATLGAFERLVPLVELGLLAVLVARVRRLRVELRLERARTSDALDAWERSLVKVLGSRVAAAIFVTEMAVLAHALRGWRRPVPARADAQVFAYHRRRGYPALLGTILVVLVFETVGLHLVVSRFNATLAWVLTALGVYGLLWLLGDLNAARLRPVLVEAGTLHLRAALRWRAAVPLDSIEAVENAPPPAGAPRVSFALIGAPDFWVRTGEAV